MRQTLYSNYLCLVASNKQQIHMSRIQKKLAETLDRSENYVLISMESVWIVQYLASGAIW